MHTCHINYTKKNDGQTQPNSNTNTLQTLCHTCGQADANVSDCVKVLKGTSGGPTNWEAQDYDTLLRQYRNQQSNHMLQITGTAPFPRVPDHAMGMRQTVNILSPTILVGLQ